MMQEAATGEPRGVKQDPYESRETSPHVLK